MKRLLRRKARRAFTLLEVVLATAIFGTSVIILTEAFVNAMTSLSKLRRESGDAPIVRYVRGLVITVPDRDSFEQGDELYLPGDAEATWTALVEDTAVADLFRVKLTIDIVRPAEDYSATHEQTLYLLRPTWSDADDRRRLLDEVQLRLDDLEDDDEGVLIP